jgi:hypothetical protein
LPGYRPSDGILGEIPVRELTEQHFASIMLELLRMAGKREGGIRRKGLERKDEGEGGRIVSEGWYVPLNLNYGDATVCLCCFMSVTAWFRDIACSHFKAIAVECSIFCCTC